MESTTIDTTIDTKTTEPSKDEETVPSLTRTVSALPPPPTVSNQSSSYSMKTNSEVKDEDSTSGKVFSFYRSQSIATQDSSSDNTSVFMWGQNDSVMLPVFSDDHHQDSPTLVNSLSSLKLVDMELSQDRLLGITHEGSVIGMGNNDECQILNERDVDIVRGVISFLIHSDVMHTQLARRARTQVRTPRVVNVAVESGALCRHHAVPQTPHWSREMEKSLRGAGNSKGSTFKLKQRAWKVCCNDESKKKLIVLTEDGDVLCSEHEVWASNPEPLSLTSGLSSLPVVWISSGISHVVAVTQEGLAFGWGAPYFGVRTSYSKEPIQVKHLDKIIFAACGDTHTCFVDTSRRVLTAGRNNRGQLGRENKSNEIKPMPVRFEFDVDAMRVSCGSNHTLCLCKSKSEKTLHVFAWGDNRYGQIGIDDAKSRKIVTPKRIQSSSFQNMRIFNVVAGGNRSCAIAISPGSSSHAFKINSGSTLRTLATESRLSESLISSIEAFEIGKTGSTRKMLKLAKRAFGSLTSLNVCFVSATDFEVGDTADNITVDTKSMFEF